MYDRSQRRKPRVVRPRSKLLITLRNLTDHFTKTEMVSWGYSSIVVDRLREKEFDFDPRISLAEKILAECGYEIVLRKISK